MHPHNSEGRTRVEHAARLDAHTLARPALRAPPSVPRVGLSEHQAEGHSTLHFPRRMSQPPRAGELCACARWGGGVD